jgi:hypothetical protein
MIGKKYSLSNMRFRYQIFKTHKSEQPVFTAPWYWLASYYANLFSHDWNYCRIDDVKLKRSLYEWARAGSPIYEKIQYRAILKDGTILNIAAINEQQAKNIVIYGKAIAFDEIGHHDIKIHPANILRIEVVS